VNAARIVAGDEQPRPIGRGIGAADDAANEVMRGGHDLEEPASEIEAAVTAAIHHALELLRHCGRPEMAHLDVDAAVRARAPGLHLRVDGATDDVAGGALEVCVIVAHEAVHRAVEEMAAG